jgi:hypothetical protein
METTGVVTITADNMVDLVDGVVTITVDNMADGEITLVATTKTGIFLSTIITGIYQHINFYIINRIK